MEQITIGWLSGLSKEDAEKLPGKTIARVESNEFELILTFTDDSTLTIKGSGYDGSALDVNIEGH